MHNFQKPENALKRAAELRAIGRSDEALTILHSTIGHKFFRSQGWDMVQEQIMLEYVALCIDQDKLRMARDGLHQYRLISQHANVASLGKVIVELLDRAEKRLSKIKATVPDCTAVKSNILDDGTEYHESPEALMASTLQVEMKDPVTKNLHDVYRFLWEIYKMILDIMRATPKLEKVYHETARKAINFCRENGRIVEFKRLCDVLRGHYTFLLKVQNKPEMECMLKPELHIETRINQLITACDIGMWKEAFNTVEDLYTLGIRDYITKTFQGSVSILGQQKEKLLKWLAIFYEKLALIFWVSDLHLFHALAVIRYVMHIRMYKKKVTEKEVSYLCSKCVLAVLAVPSHQKYSLKSAEFSSSLSTSFYEMQKRMSTLLGYNTIPTKESLHNSLAVKKVLPLADPNVQKLYELVENDASMKLCVQLVPLIEKLTSKSKADATTNHVSSTANHVDGSAPTMNHVDGTDGSKDSMVNGTASKDKVSPPRSPVLSYGMLQKADDNSLDIYYPKIKSVVFYKVLTRLSKVYASMTIDFFTKSVCPPGFYDWDFAEKEIVDLVHRGLCHIRFDYSSKVLHFNLSTVKSDSIASIRHQLTDLGKNLYYAMRLLNPDDVNKSSEQRRLQLVSMKNNIEMERSKLLKRTSEIYQRRQEHQVEQMRMEEERKKMELQQKMNEEKAEKERREEALRQLELQRKRDEKYKIKSEVASQILKELKRICNQSTTKVYVKGKALEDLTVEELVDGSVDYEDLEKAQEEHMLREKQECLKQRKAEVRRVEHLLRAVRDRDRELYPAYVESLLKSDTELLMEVQKRREYKYKQDAEAMLEEKNLFKTVLKEKKEWVEAQMVVRRKEYEELVEEQKNRFKELLVTEKIARARHRYQQDLYKRQQEEQKRLEEEQRKEEELRRLIEQQLKEEEQRRLREEEEKRRQQEELRRQKLDEMAKIQRMKQEEIERKLAGTYQETTEMKRGVFGMEREAGMRDGFVRGVYSNEGREVYGNESRAKEDDREELFSRETFGIAREDNREVPANMRDGFVRDTRAREGYLDGNREAFGRAREDSFGRDGRTFLESRYKDDNRDGFSRNNMNKQTEEEDWRNESKKTVSKGFRNFGRKLNKKPSDDDGNWR